MAVQFKIPKSPTKQVYESTRFLGADFTSEASTVDDTRSPNCVNFIRSVPGKIRKRMGYELVSDYEEWIYGVHYFSVLDTYFIHAGTGLYNINGYNGGKWVASAVTSKSLVCPKAIIPERDYYIEFYYSESIDTMTTGYAQYLIDQWAQEIEPPEVEDWTYKRRTAQLISFRLVSSHRWEIKYTVTFYYERVDQDIDYIVNEDDNNIVLLDGKTSSSIIYEGMAEHRSVAFELNGKLIILDGYSMKYVDSNGSVGEISDIAYIPTLDIDKEPEGGGTDNEALNLLQPAFIELFYVSATREGQPSYDPSTVVDFQLSFGDLDNTEVLAWTLDSDGEWQLKEEDTDFTVDRETGVVTFVTGPGASPVQGESNVKIQAYKTFDGYADRINKCTIGTMFGVNGAHDRIFVSGNPGSGVNSNGDAFTYKNCDWFSQIYDPTYWPDLNYSKLGADSSAIMGYSIVNNYLATHKDKREQAQSILIREGDLVDDEPVFRLINTLQGAGALSKYCFSYLETEPVFLSALGIYAVTAQDITGEKYAQDRSYYLEGKLLKEPNLENAHGFTWKDYYILAVNDNLYILDGLQPTQTDKAKPYSTRQYAGFFFSNVPATCFFEKDDQLYFGSATGKIYRFFKDEKDIKSYNDDGEKISCLWETADISEKLFYKKKTYRYIAVRCMPEIQSSIKISARKEGIWYELKNDVGNIRYFTYSSLIYSKMSYSTDESVKISAAKIRLKKLDHVRFKFENDVLNEALGINDFAVEYTQAGNVK